MRNPTTKIRCSFYIFFILIFQSTFKAAADLNSDEQALLAFAKEVPHGRKLNWSPLIPICPSWTGITCNPEKTHVIALRLPGVGLSGPIPPNTISNLTSLQTLSLRSNLLRGNFPPEILALPSLRYLYIQRNNFSGEIPSDLSTNLTQIDLSNNDFVGKIPQTIGNLTQLTGLFLENNSLMGSIPDVDLPKLKHLNLSYNQLNGSIPISLQNFSNSSFLGNPFLCGPPLLLQCTPVLPTPSPSPFIPIPLSPPHEPPSKKKISTGAIVAIGVGGAALLFLIAAVFLVFCVKENKGEDSNGEVKVGKKGERPKDEFGVSAQEGEKNKLVFFEGCSYTFDLEDLLRASAEVLGKGSFGTAYKAVLEDGTTVVVKRLKEVVVGKREFEGQMEMIGRGVLLLQG
ncbi:hypothetical protein AMTR_s00077p00144650 [Amborella trichopoda]|uniref:Leucine-rich repeat-containing N-terminal plant-type domain-containing protein n=1 Tax=Amborella trichopoda TaxID=13333 RepID=W1P8J6_AMBTC|nr:hypothetical protein AMTR_s00077p00144650 [Amborella trichopoda]